MRNLRRQWPFSTQELSREDEKPSKQKTGLPLDNISTEMFSMSQQKSKLNGIMHLRVHILRRTLDCCTLYSVQQRRAHKHIMTISTDVYNRLSILSNKSNYQ